MIRKQYLHSFLPTHNRLSVKVVKAILKKNYGLKIFRNNPYVRLHIGDNLYETPIWNGRGRLPHWNRTVSGHLPDGIESIGLQLFYYRPLVTDEMLAWAHIHLPYGIFDGKQVVDQWFPLSGEQGEGKEGLINLVLSFSARPDPFYYDALPATGPAPLLIEVEREVNELQQRFPYIERDVIKQMLRANEGNKRSAEIALTELDNSWRRSSD